MRVLDENDGSVHHGADSDGNAPQRHDVCIDALDSHHDERQEDADGQRENDHQRGSQVQQKKRADERHQRNLDQQGVGKVADGAFDQRAAVVDGHDLHTGRQAGLQFLEALAHPFNGLKRILAVAHHDDPARHLAFAVEFCDPPAHLRSDLDPGDVADPNRGPLCIHADGDLFDVLDGLDVSQPPDHVFGLGHFHEPAADIAVGAHDGLPDGGNGYVVGKQCVGVHDHLVLLDVSADRRHFGDTGYGLQRIAQVPVLNRSQLRKIQLAASVHQGVLVDPPDPGGVGSQRRRDSVRQTAADVVEVFQHA